MQKITIYLAMLLLLVSTGVSAQQPEAMNVHKTDGAVLSASLVTIEHITFEGDVLVLTTSEGTFQLPLNNVDYIVFGEKRVTTDVENIDVDNIRVSLEGNDLAIESDYTINALYLVDITGKLLVSQKLSSTYAATIQLPNSGVFVLFLETSQGYVARKILNN